MRLRLGWNTAVCLVSLAVVLGLVAAIAFGLLEPVAVGKASARRSAIGALTAYWFLFFTIVWLVPFAVRHPRQVFVCLIASAAALLVLEFTMRALVPGATSVSLAAGGFRAREFHHIYPAHTRRYMGRRGGTPVFLDTNEDGLRTGYSREQFKQYDQRIVLLGDSSTFGQGVGAEAAFPSRLEAHLRQSAGAGTVAVLNAGIVSYSPFLEKLLFEKKLVEYRPTFVVLVLDVTDIGDDYVYMNAAQWSGESWVFPFQDARPVRYWGALRELMRPYLLRLRMALSYPFELAGYEPPPNADEYYDFEITIGNVREKNRFFVYRHPLDEMRPLFDQTLRNVDEIAGRAARLGARFALVITPRFHHWNVNECPNNWESNEYGLAEPYQFEYFRYFDEAQRDYPIINLLPDFKATKAYPLVFADDPHWNAAGHAFVAETLKRHLLRLGTIPPAGPGASSTLPSPRAE